MEGLLLPQLKPQRGLQQLYIEHPKFALQPVHLMYTPWHLHMWRLAWVPPLEGESSDLNVFTHVQP